MQRAVTSNALLAVTPERFKAFKERCQAEAKQTRNSKFLGTKEFGLMCRTRPYDAFRFGHPVDGNRVILFTGIQETETALPVISTMLLCGVPQVVPLDHILFIALSRVHPTKDIEVEGIPVKVRLIPHPEFKESRRDLLEVSDSLTVLGNIGSIRNGCAILGQIICTYRLPYGAVPETVFQINEVATLLEQLRTSEPAMKITSRIGELACEEELQ